MKILVGNSKGGAGKSTTAVQIIAPYLYEKFDKKIVTLIEFDDENKDSETFLGSSIIDTKQIEIIGNDLSSEIIDAILENDNLIVDIGGNKTTTIILDELENNGMFDAFDAFVIPLMDGEQDSVNSIRIYKRVRELSSSIKIIFALSKVDKNMSLEMQFFDFFGDTKNRINGAKGLIEQIHEDDRNIISIHSSDAIKYSRIFGNTVYEIAQKDSSELKAELSESMQNKNDDLSRKLSYKMGILNTAKKYLANTIIPCFDTLDKE